MAEQIIDPQTGPDVTKRNYGGTSPTTTLVWIVVAIVAAGLWLAFVYRHYFSKSEFPQTSSVHQSVAYAPPGSGEAR